MISTFKLLNSYFWKTFYGPIVAFVFPVLILSIVGSIFDIRYVLPGIIAMSSMFIAVLALPLAIMELRSSSLFKYIGSSPIDSRKFSIVVVLYYVGLIMISIILLMLATLALFPEDSFGGSERLLRLDIRSLDAAKDMLKSQSNSPIFERDNSWVDVPQSIFSWLRDFRSFLSFIFSNILHVLLCVSIGLLISTFSKTPQQALTISLVIVIPSMFLSGMVVSVDIIGQSDSMSVVSRAFPFRYTTGNIVESTTPIRQTGLYYTGAQWDLIHKNKSLQNLILNEQVPLMQSTSSSIFDFTTGFAVRRVPSVSQVQAFVENFLGGDDFSGIDLTSDFGWLDLFTHLNSRLYTTYEKALNIFIPLIISAGSLLYISKNFKWNAR